VNFRSLAIGQYAIIILFIISCARDADSIVPPVIITAISPASGYVGDTITIVGNNFNADKTKNTVKVGSMVATVIAAESSKLSFTIPAQASTNKISVTVGNSTATTKADFLVTVPVEVTDFKPAIAYPKDTITLNGAHFDFDKSKNSVKFGSIQAIVTAANNTQLRVVVPIDASTGKISVTVGRRTATTLHDFVVADFIVPNPVTLASYIPSSGYVGDVVTITGTNFDSDKTKNIVKFGNALAEVSSAIPNQLTVIVPANATTDKISIAVGGTIVTFGSDFIVLTPIAITNINPTSGYVGDVITITGSNFDTDKTKNIVKVGDIPAQVSGATTNQLTVVVPAEAITAKISVRIGANTATSATDFIVVSPITITGFNPSSGYAGDVITITGTNFDIDKTKDIVRFGAIVSEVLSATANELTVAVPSNATTDKISVSVGSSTATSASDFVVLHPITITGFNPASGYAGDVMTILGTNFDPDKTKNSVKFGNTIAQVTSVTADQLTVVVPADAITSKISVSIGANTATSPTDFIVFSPVTITKFSPSSGYAGDAVTITGTNFDLDKTKNSVSFGNIVAQISSASATELSVIVPANAATGKVTVSTGGNSVASAIDFIVINPVTIISFSPSSGYVGDIVTIIGTNFDADKTKDIVKFGNTIAQVSSASAEQLSIVVPSGATSGRITVTTGTKTAISTSDFIVLSPVAITSFNPSSGYVGDVITITGANFDLDKTKDIVKFGNTIAQVSSASAAQLSVVVPSGATSGKIAVTTGTKTATSISDFTVLSPVAITGFNPSSGYVGDVITITGTNFDLDKTKDIVKFGNTIAQVLTVSSTQLTAAVPAGTVSNKISITVNGRLAISLLDFIVRSPVTFISFSPTSGSEGDMITLVGTNFDVTKSNNSVKFGNINAVVTSATTSQLMATVPAGASSGKISVTVGPHTATSATDFTVIANAPTWSSVYPLVAFGATTVDLRFQTDKQAKVYWVIADQAIPFTPQDLKQQATASTNSAIKFKGITPIDANVENLEKVIKLLENKSYYAYFICESITGAVLQQNVKSVSFTTYFRQATGEYNSVAENRKVLFLIYRPEEVLKYPTKKYPICFFLGGNGEVTTQGQINLIRNGSLPEYITKNDVPMIVMSIQHIVKSWNTTMIDEGVDYAMATYPVDVKRVYMTGISGGGFGCWNYALGHAAKLTAIVPISGGGNNGQACNIKSLPIWAFHNQTDPIVNISASQNMINAINACTAPKLTPKFTIFPDDGHDCWRRIYDQNSPDWTYPGKNGIPKVDIYAWLLTNSK
jgi:predicted esterase